MQKETGFIVKGKLHEECDESGCGEKFTITGTNERVELEEGEAVIIPEAFEPQCFSDSFCKKPATYKMSGTIKQIASAINMLGGGSNFESGAQVWKNGRKVTTPKYTAENQRRNPKNIKSGSVIINRTNMNNPQVMTFEGTAYDIASQINSYGGNGVVLDGAENDTMQTGGELRAKKVNSFWNNLLEEFKSDKIAVRHFNMPNDELVDRFINDFNSSNFTEHFIVRKHPTERKVVVSIADHDKFFSKGGEAEVDNDKIYKEWKSLVNMSLKEIRDFYNSEEGEEAGLSRSEADELGIDYGRESARWIMNMKQTPEHEWTDKYWKWAKKQISFIKRMRGNKGDLYDEKGNKTRKHTSLLIWGHDPNKYKETGGAVEKRYVAEADYFVFAEDDEDAKQKAQAEVDKLDPNLTPSLIHLYEQPVDPRLKRKIFNKGGEVTLTKEQIKELGKLIEAETKAVNKLRSFYELRSRQDYQEKSESIDIATAIWRTDKEGDLTQGQFQRERLIQWAKDPKNKVKFIVAFSGGKDSVAMVLDLIHNHKIPQKDIELWHHEVDGHGEDLWDWKCTTSYCKAFAEAYGLDILFSYRDGGITREIYRKDEGLQDIYYQSKVGGEYHHVPAIVPKAKDRKTKYKFPAKSKDLNTRWCSANVKIDVMKTAINNNPDYTDLTAIICTGERRLESSNRAGYLEIEPYNFARDRQVIQWRPIIDWDEEQIWDAFRRKKIQPHPAYMLGWGRCSCQLCIFSSPNHWATNNAISPEKIQRIADIEKETGSMLDNKPHVEPMRDESGEIVLTKTGKNKGKPRMVKKVIGKDKKGNNIYEMRNIFEAQVDVGSSFLDLENPTVKRWLPEAIGEFKSPIFVKDWQLPEGAFKGDDCGAD
jgi:3'-phosphoadenosine 5'-phosphosulfate sulfotransferase (PAPS reductase)/FAD synthetase